MESNYLIQKTLYAFRRSLDTPYTRSPSPPENSGPARTQVGERSQDMGDNLAPKVVDVLQRFLLQVIVHEGNGSGAVVDLLDAEPVAGHHG